MNVDPMSEPRQQGVVKRLLHDKGYGFITGPTDDVFMHRSWSDPDIFDELQVGGLVTYREQVGPKGQRALDVQRQVGRDQSS